ncbi:hypothetical protein OEZ85_011656 [Tetradesmus obliquus]|uniref:Uncharacterized protein n=1 Tax=Tetradesmus obliquus TaxID=3088 RepID=A0ABY8TRC0_TETOB|nr:hypothetical protein OEZ85_011656 [Tetradesmus obliquus]
MKNDRAAEAALQCVLALLQRVQGLEQDQVLPVLQAAARLLALPPGAATEEMRLKAVVGAVGGGPRLAFFLPGLASGLAKQLLAAVPPAAGVPVTGAASSSSSTALILQYLSSFESYKACAGLARALGRAARLADAQLQPAAGAGDSNALKLLPRLWGLPTSQAGAAVDAAAAAAADPASRQQLPAQVLGANALLLRCLIDCTGSIARCAGTRFSSNTKLLRGALLPLFEHLAGPCPLVAAAAGTALASICRHCGYPLGLGQLVGQNADYVVDGVCKRLRSLQQHPRAPQLLAALLQEAGVAAQLLPLLAEPLRAALSVS